VQSNNIQVGLTTLRLIMEKSDLKKNYILERSGRTSFEELRVDETIFSLTNGSLGTRGHFIEGYGSGDYPQTLMNGFYNTYPFVMRKIINNFLKKDKPLSCYQMLHM